MSFLRRCGLFYTSTITIKSQQMTWSWTDGGEYTWHMSSTFPKNNTTRPWKLGLWSPKRNHWQGQQKAQDHPTKKSERPSREQTKSSTKKAPTPHPSFWARLRSDENCRLLQPPISRLLPLTRHFLIARQHHSQGNGNPRQSCRLHRSGRERSENVNLIGILTCWRRRLETSKMTLELSAHPMKWLRSTEVIRFSSSWSCHYLHK